MHLKSVVVVHFLSLWYSSTWASLVQDNSTFAGPIPSIHNPTSASIGSIEPVMSVLPHGTISTIRTPGSNITRAIFSNGPINIMNWPMIQDLQTFTVSLYNQSHTKVVILQSANPSFFIAQLSLLEHDGWPTPTEQTKTFIDAAYDISTLPVIFIASIAGRARGAGNELVLQCDLRYAARGRTFLGNFETAIGLIPGAGGIAYLASLIGRAKAFEYVLSGRDIDADTAERIGWVNHAVDSYDLDGVVGAFAERLALFPVQALAAAKKRINEVSLVPPEQVWADYNAWVPLVGKPFSAPLASKEMKLSMNESFGEYQLYEGDEVLRVYE
ncbi:ClpP/crotonase [Penicillium subrubescens]|uniref:Uncharacterized protein n=1 Tax=Penicillium subrubescens TaxID=1316194 RepID=A0A1Q5TT35_9EURO|nr:ClpP/crotonase [Penicillium subrubescens]KAJ5910782.1 ClpP/crotonase [Penicillium subrubescens]OKP03375.1 hypothetical protein PENSUB_6878 [Penicillium subrubescens]